MNIILINEREKREGLSLKDERALHLLNIIKPKENERIKFGVLNENGIYSFKYKRQERLYFNEYTFLNESKPLKKISIIIALSRPLVMKRIFKDLSTLRIKEIIVFPSKLSEKSYLDSSFLKDENYKSSLIEGAMQGYSTFLPQVKIKNNLDQALEEVKNHNRILLDVNGREKLLNLNEINEASLIVGSERGFTKAESEKIHKYNFQSFNLGESILRVETSTIAASVILANKVIG